MVSSVFLPSLSVLGALPMIETGDAAPRFVPGAIGARCGAKRMNVPALAARAPHGATKEATGPREASIALLHAGMEDSRPASVWILSTPKWQQPLSPFAA